MINKKIWLYFAFFLLLTIIYVNAADFEVSSEAIKDYIESDQTAEFTVNVINHGHSDTFRITVLSEAWKATIDEYLLNVPVDSTRSTRITLKPIRAVNIGSNSVLVLVTALNNPERTLQHRVIVNVKEFDKIVNINAELPLSVDPRRDLPLQLTFKNKGFRKLENIEVILTSSAVEQQNFLINLGSTEELTKDIVLDVKSNAKAGQHKLDVILNDDNKEIGSETFILNVASSSEVKEKRSVEDGTFVDVLTIEKTNTGNAISYESVTVSISWLKKLFTKLYPGDYVKENNNYIWDFDLKQGETYKITAVTDYRPSIIALLLVILFGVIAYMIAMKKVHIKKKVSVVKKGEFNVLRVVLDIKNNTGYKLKDIEIVDYLPSLIKHTEEFETIKPYKILKGSAGVKLIWKLEELHKDEERVISYDIKLRLPVIGIIGLPRAEVMYRNKKGKVITNYSNFVKVTG